MKKMISLCLTLFISLMAFSQQPDYTLARTGTYVMGVYLFIECEPINAYDYVGKVDQFDIFESDSKQVEKIIEKAKKKNPHFDGMIFKKGFKHVELIKFKELEESVAGFEIGMQVQYESFGRLIKGEIVDIIPHRERATVKYIDEEGKERLDGVALKALNRL